jgi:G:T-mismatch repair DNA endonuclease (very short patch repair protein)
MADTVTAEQRSERMWRVQQKDTALEMLVRKELHHRDFSLSAWPSRTDGTA